MPEEECEDESDSDAHDPRYEHAHQQPQVGQRLEDRDELRHRLELLREHLRLCRHLLQLLLLVHRLLFRRRLKVQMNGYLQGQWFS